MTEISERSIACIIKHIIFKSKLNLRSTFSLVINLLWISCRFFKNFTAFCVTLYNIFPAGCWFFLGGGGVCATTSAT